MKGRALVLSALMILSVVGAGIAFGAGTATAANDPADLTASDLPGSGTSDDPYQISNASELQAIEDDLSANYTLVSDVDASETSEWNSGQGFDPIGDDPFSGYEFNGSFDGNDYTISNLTINRSSEDNTALFGYIGSDATITNTNLEDVNVTGNSQVSGLVGENNGGTVDSSSAAGNVSGESTMGGLVGYNNAGTVNSSHAKGNVSGNGQIGGLVGWNDGTINSSYTTGTVSGGGGNQVGGLVGWNEGGTVNSSYATGNVTGDGDEKVGGLVGWSEGGTITSSYATGDVNGYAYVGGLVGQSSGTVISSNASGSVTATSWEVGGLIGTNKGGTIDSSNATGDVSSVNEGLAAGLVGYNTGTVDSSYATGNVSGDWQIGGLIGWSTGLVNSSYATGTVSGGGGNQVGGLIGWNDGGTVDNSYATGNVTGDGDNQVGGLVGDNDVGAVNASYATGTVSGSTDTGGLVGSNSGTVNDAYWDVNTTDQDTSAGGTGLTTSQLKANTSLAGFDFGNTWDVIGYDNGTYISYPYLLDNTQSPEPGLELYDSEGPTAEAGSDQTVDEDTTVNFDGTGSSDNVGITSYDWDFDDGTTATGPTPSHTYTDPGTYTVTLTVSDDAGNTDTDTVTITVEDTTAPSISSFDTSNPSGQDVKVSFDSDEQLSTISVSISGVESGTLTKADFTETDNGEGTYTYEATYAGSSDGDYTATLETADDAAGNDGSSSQSDTVSIASSSSGGTGGGEISTGFEVQEQTDEGSTEDGSMQVSIQGYKVGDELSVPTENVGTDAVAVEGVSVSFDMGTNVANEMSIRSGNEPPENVPAYSETEDADYVSVDIEGNLADRVISGTITVRLAEDKIPDDPTEVTAYHYRNGEWEPVEIIHLGDQRFEIRASDYSTFAIVLQQEAEITTTATTTTNLTTTTTTTTEEPVETTTEEPVETTTEEPVETTTTETPGFTIGLALIALLGATLLALRRRV